MEKVLPVAILDSVSQLTSEHRGAIIVCGSHGGISAARHALTFLPSAIFFSDAGRGKNDAGIEGLRLFDEHAIPAAAVDIWSARIGDGRDIYESGRLSSVNQAAKESGLTEDMSVMDAVRTLTQYQIVQEERNTECCR